MKNHSFDNMYWISSKIKQSIVGLLVLLSMSSVIHAKGVVKWRSFLQPLHFNLAIGYGATPYRIDAVNAAIFKKGDAHYIYLPGGGQSGYLIRWFNQPYVFELLYESGDRLETIGTMQRGKRAYFEGTGHTIPISLSSHIDIFKKLRMEIGGTLYMTFLKSLQSNEARRNELGTYVDPIGKHYMLKSYLMSGFKLWDTKDYTLLFNVQAGLDFFYGRGKAIRATKTPMAVGMGFTLEKHISEYVSFSGRLLYEYANSVDMIKPLRGINVNRQGIYLQLGCTFNCPEIPKCTLPHCDIPVKHKHSNKMYRGASIFKGRTPQEERLF
eukprot:gene710-881_t